ncbi:PIN domain-containing protein [Halorussus lipolyticus]|uniref:PIN domain-containing protein n=1 Tax=Halorussus lipolyticus TaxID=3034024 RepID=UPI0023E7823F|nr:PIN domain-containing protein [Halorussus sp. DT80]
MKCLDSSVLIAYLEEDETALHYISDHLDEPLYAPSLALFEVYQGAVFGDDEDEPEVTRQHLDWLDDILPFTEATALETARLQSELLDEGTPLAPRDAMIAGSAREVGATLVSEDGDLTNDGVKTVMAAESYE